MEQADGLRSALSARLARAREARELTQAALAGEAAVPHVMMVSGWERGLNLPRVDYLAAMSRVLGVSLDWLCGLSEVGGPRPRKRGRASGKQLRRVLVTNTPGRKSPENGSERGAKLQAISGSKEARNR